MQGHGFTQPPQPQRPSPGTLVVLRVIFVALPLLSCGFLAWAPTLRVAVVTRSRLNWLLFCANVALNITWIVLLSMDNTDDFSTPQGNAGMIGMLSTGAAAIAYFLYADFRHYSPHTPLYPGYYPPPAPQQSMPMPPPQPGYGYPPRHTAPAPTPTPTPPPTPAPAPMPPQPQPQHPAPPRIDQVRAELDELSDYLRREEGR
ncbi:hypothetical protein [Streptomyces sp. NPDC051219]|uniref:hypothetical protein n=1 Tax=Streptomyces sp. NPDC051219 TaxID=3155283 RepID=UPI0034344C87